MIYFQVLANGLVLGGLLVQVDWRWIPDQEAAPILAGMLREGTWEDGWP